MDQMTSEITVLLGCLHQPAFAVRAQLIVFANAAANAAGITDGLSIHALLGDESGRYLAHDGAGALSLQLETAAGRYHANVLRASGHDIFLLEPAAQPPEAEARLLAFADLAQALRLPVANLFATASNLFPYLEQFEDPSVQRQMAVLNKNFYQLLRTIGNLSESMRLLPGEYQPRFEAVELHGWFSDLAASLTPLCQAAGIPLSVKCPAGMTLAQIDPARLSRAVLNLVSNALKHSAPGSAIALSLDVGRTGARIRIADHGDGMEPEALSDAFSRYRQTPGVDPRSGIGLGLPIARQIASEHGGTVVIHSQPGEGTTAVLSISLGADGGRALRTPTVGLSGFDPLLVELADALPSEIFDSENVN